MSQSDQYTQLEEKPEWFDDLPLYLQAALVAAGVGDESWITDPNYAGAAPDWVQQQRLANYFGFVSPGGLAPLYAGGMFTRAFTAGWLTPFGLDPGGYGYASRQQAALQTANQYLGRYPTEYVGSQLGLWDARSAYYVFQQNWTPTAEAWSAVRLGSYFSPEMWKLRALGFPFYSAAQQVGAGAAMAPYVQSAYQIDPANTLSKILSSPTFWPGQYPDLASTVFSGLVEWTGLQSAGWLLGGATKNVGGMLGVGFLQAGLGIAMAPLATYEVRGMWGLPAFAPGTSEAQSFFAQEALGWGLAIGGGYASIKYGAFAARISAGPQLPEMIGRYGQLTPIFRSPVTGQFIQEPLSSTALTAGRLTAGTFGWVAGGFLGGPVGEALGPMIPEWITRSNDPIFRTLATFVRTPEGGRVAGTLIGELAGSWAALKYLSEPVGRALTSIAGRLGLGALGGLALGEALGPLGIALAIGQPVAELMYQQTLMEYGGVGAGQLGAAWAARGGYFGLGEQGPAFPSPLDQGAFAREYQGLLQGVAGLRYESRVLYNRLGLRAQYYGAAGPYSDMLSGLWGTRIGISSLTQAAGRTGLLSTLAQQGRWGEYWAARAQATIAYGVASHFTALAQGIQYPSQAYTSRSRDAFRLGQPGAYITFPGENLAGDPYRYAPDFGPSAFVKPEFPIPRPQNYTHTLFFGSQYLHPDEAYSAGVTLGAVGRGMYAMGTYSVSGFLSGQLTAAELLQNLISAGWTPAEAQNIVSQVNINRISTDVTFTGGGKPTGWQSWDYEQKVAWIEAHPGLTTPLHMPKQTSPNVPDNPIMAAGGFWWTQKYGNKQFEAPTGYGTDPNRGWKRIGGRMIYVGGGAPAYSQGYNTPVGSTLFSGSTEPGGRTRTTTRLVNGRWTKVTEVYDPDSGAWVELPGE